LVVAQSSSEIPEGLMNNSVYDDDVLRVQYVRKWHRSNGHAWWLSHWLACHIGCTCSRSGGTDFGNPSSHNLLLIHCSTVVCISTERTKGYRELCPRWVPRRLTVVDKSDVSNCCSSIFCG
jgi:hypothetical protein